MKSSERLHGPPRRPGREDESEPHPLEHALHTGAGARGNELGRLLALEEPRDARVVVPFAVAVVRLVPFHLGLLPIDHRTVLHGGPGDPMGPSDPRQLPPRIDGGEHDLSGHGEDTRRTAQEAAVGRV